MTAKFIEATEPSNFNHGKFMVGRFTAEEWARRSAIDVDQRLLRRCGWAEEHIVVMDLQTGEGAFFRPGGFAHADLNDKHKVWVCPMFEPFLAWLYEQDLTDLDKLPALVTLPEGTETAMWGYRRRGEKCSLKDGLPTTVPEKEQDESRHQGLVQEPAHGPAETH